MEPLHAPWRLDYILMPKPAPSEGSLFTQIAQSNEDVANLVLARERTCFAVMNAYPYTGGHLMTVPYKPVPDFNGLTDQEILDLMLLTRRCQNALTKVMKPDGFNIGVNLGQVAGAGILEHLHIHVVPRRKKDGLKGFFWPRTPYKSDDEASAVQQKLQVAIGACRAMTSAL